MKETVIVNAKGTFDYFLEFEECRMTKETAELLKLALEKTSGSLTVLNVIAERAKLEVEELEAEENAILESIVNHCLTGK